MNMEHPESLPVSDMTTMAVHLSYVRRDLESMNKKLDSLINTFVTEGDFKEHLKADADHEERIRVLEEFHNTLIGKMWGVGMLAGLIVGIISFIANHYL